ncbi:LPXTG cell wall anchor domain-containing protein [Enterococcus sp. DIV1298c]|uniref:LPXTG cell wall anchor domain-containing protein n=1 Tax=Enterococcus sp. DIV1298c TaxID=2815328 RepID=UPI001A913061|nr:LPXTG cell wall anchor domain-containing protein [Enterococcus sp. DIV1298c]MBO0462761.1 LPXTG cell wall anchor domain-containing protein [Enterococcus sp. DIV1298c]
MRKVKQFLLIVGVIFLTSSSYFVHASENRSFFKRVEGQVGSVQTLPESGSETSVGPEADNGINGNNSNVLVVDTSRLPNRTQNKPSLLANLPKTGSEGNLWVQLTGILLVLLSIKFLFLKKETQR